MTRATATILLAAVAAAIVGGCDARRAPRFVSSVDYIQPMASPAAMNYDNVPGPDGFDVGVTLWRHDAPEAPVALDGTLEILLFDGLADTKDLATRQPLRVWQFSRDQLRRFAVAGPMNVGISYGMSLRWAPNDPTENSITVFVRCPGTQGRELYSEPLVINVVTQ